MGDTIMTLCVLRDSDPPPLVPPQERDDAHHVTHLLCSLHPVRHRHHPGLQVTTQDMDTHTNTTSYDIMGYLPCTVIIQAFR